MLMVRGWHFDAALELYRQVGNRPGEANALKASGDLRLRVDDLAGAKDAYEEALGLYRQVGDRLGAANAEEALLLLEETRT
jgi:hypothetical protein